MDLITLDFETYSECDLKKSGAVKYSEHPSTEILCLSWAINDGEPQLWLPGDPPPLYKRPGVFDAHGALFERSIWSNVGVRKHGWSPVPLEQWDCTMARAASRAMPLGLDECARALGLDAQKDKRGRQLIRLLCMPRKPTKKDPRIRIQDPDLLQELYDYCKQDVRVEQELRRQLGKLSADEHACYILNERMNDRGVTIDLAGVHDALAIVTEVEGRLTEELDDITFGAVETHNQVAKMQAWLHDENVHLDDLTAGTVEKALKDYAYIKGTPAYRVLQIRQSLAKASTKKLNALIAATGRDGRVRGLSQHHGTFTGRNAGRLVQPLNLPRPKLDVDTDELVEAISHRDASWLEAVYGDPMTAVADALRHMFMAATGKVLVAGDLASIESVGLAGLAGEETKLDVFRQGKDPYSVFATQALGRLITKQDNPRERQEVGKPGELAFGYGGGVGAWRNFDDSDRFDDDEVNVFKNAWRRSHPRISTPPWSEDEEVGLWYGLQQAAIDAVVKGGRHWFREISYEVKGRWLVCYLPSGRPICYYDPRVEEEEKWGRAQLVLSYMSVKKGRWQRVATWGGKLAENVTQAACRDILEHGKARAEAIGLPILMSVYDELVAEVSDQIDLDAALKNLLQCMTDDVPKWCQTWPIKAAGWYGKRYRKD